MAIDVLEQNFKEKVIDPSFRTPVLIDFWADWCGPCKMLSPVLEKLEREYRGGFILAKINTDQNPNLSMMFRISSIPDVRMIKEGKIHDQFMGALPEKEIRNFLNKHVSMPAEEGLAGLAKSKPLEALKIIKNSIEEVENRSKILWTAFLSYLSSSEDVDGLKEIISTIDEEDASFANQRTLALNYLEKHGKAGLLDLKNLSNPDKKTAVLEKFLAKVENAPYSNRGKEKEELLVCFYILNPEDEDLFQFRRKLSSLLF